MLYVLFAPAFRLTSRLGGGAQVEPHSTVFGCTSSPVAVGGQRLVPADKGRRIYALMECSTLTLTFGFRQCEVFTSLSSSRAVSPHRPMAEERTSSQFQSD